ncbi:MAG: hypothetical protein IPF65_05955 [Polaromonas sp.]|nr:hypothetical protein [Polaromonas sp.]
MNDVSTLKLMMAQAVLVTDMLDRPKSIPCLGTKSEELLLSGVNTYVLGEFSTLGIDHINLSLSQEVSALLSEWKRDSKNLVKRFDLNGNGEIDMDEGIGGVWPNAP